MNDYYLYHFYVVFCTIYVTSINQGKTFVNSVFTANRGTTMGEMQAAWAALKDNERKQYRTEASELPKISLVKLTDEQKRLKKEKLVKKVENIVRLIITEMYENIIHIHVYIKFMLRSTNPSNIIQWPCKID